jgi:hypothetical protein
MVSDEVCAVSVVVEAAPQDPPIHPLWLAPPKPFKVSLNHVVINGSTHPNGNNAYFDAVIEGCEELIKT